MGGRLAVAYDVSMTKECSPRWIEVEYRRATKPGRPEMGGRASSHSEDKRQAINDEVIVRGLEPSDVQGGPGQSEYG